MKRAIMNLRNLKYTDTPTPMLRMSDFLIDLQQQCQPKDVKQHEKGLR